MCKFIEIIERTIDNGVFFDTENAENYAIKLMKEKTRLSEIIEYYGLETLNKYKLNKSLTNEQIKTISDYFKVSNELSNLDNLFKNYNTHNNRIHGNIEVDGTITKRCTHSNPNMAGLPKGELRKFITVTPNRKSTLMGFDASGLELRILSHYLTPYDNGEYKYIVLNGDIHIFNMEKAGLSKRDQAKTFVYSFIYGAGDKKLSEVLGVSEYEASKVKKDFLKNVKGIKELKSFINEQVFENQGHIKTIDGSMIPVESSHTSLNYLIQSTGAIIMKKTLEIFDDSLQAEGFRPGFDYEFILNVHDEIQLEIYDTNESKEDFFSHMAIQAIKAAGEYYNITTELDCEVKFGKSWFETH